ncbi:TIGR04104 family putative zinc finger protein [Oceanobacillus limi]|uniref:TIGR04104 family putative zinc finger protein n=1 Tax=Oceanobacillus limi TaxID=930131 RepID=UPI00147AD6FA
MQKCEKCHTKFKWIDIYRSVWKSTNKKTIVHCRQCETEHIINIASRIINGFIAFVTVFTSSYLVFFRFDIYGLLSFFSFILVQLVLMALVFTITPFLFKFHSKYHSNYKV